MTNHRKRTLKSYERRGPNKNTPDVNNPQNKPKTRRETNQERVAPKNGQERLIRLVVALPEDQAVRLLAAARMYCGGLSAPLCGKVANQIVLFALDKLFRDLEDTYAYSQFWQGIKDRASEEIRGVK